MPQQDLHILQGLKIIIVDDNIQFRSTLRKLLEAQFVCKIIAEAGDGEEFLTLSNIFYADVVMLDLMMPNLDGYGTMKRINVLYPFLKVIAITMQYENAYLQRLIELGFRGCLFKYNLYENITEALLRVIDNKLFFPIELLSRKQ